MPHRPLTHTALVTACLLLLLAVVPTACQRGTGSSTTSSADTIDWVDSTDKLHVTIVNYYNSNSHDSLVMLAPIALDLCRQHRIWNTYYNIWRLYCEEYVFSGQPDSALMEAKKLHEEAVEEDDSMGLSLSYYIQGLAYDIQGNNKEAARIQELALQRIPHNEYLQKNSIYLYYLGELNTLADTAKIQQALAGWQELLHEEARQTDLKPLAVYNHSYWYYRQKFLYDFLLEDYKTASQDIDSICYYLDKVGWNLINRNEVPGLRLELAIGQDDNQTALKLSDEMLQGKDSLESAAILNAKKQRTTLLANMGRWKEAYLESRECVALTDSVRNAESIEQLNELNKRFELDELKMQAERERMAAERHQLFFVFAFIVLILLGLVLFGLYRYRSAKRMAKIRAAQERLEGELKIARDIQMSMVPNTFPEIEGLDMYASMVPAREVGGDLYGYVQQGDMLYFAVGDVSGKGIPASLFMAQATRLFRTMANQGMEPAAICTRMNSELSGDDNVNGMFVTMFIGKLNLQTGHLSFCNAGHNPPVIAPTLTSPLPSGVAGAGSFTSAEPGGGSPSFLHMESNAPIGLWPDLEYVGEEIASIKGCMFFVYTDGLNEAENPAQQQFGDDRLLDILRSMNDSSSPLPSGGAGGGSFTSQQVIETLAAEVEVHRQGAEPNDDLTMLCLRMA